MLSLREIFVIIVVTLCWHCKSGASSNAAQNELWVADAALKDGDFLSARKSLNNGDHTVFLVSDNYPRARKQVSIFLNCSNYIEAAEREKNLVSFITEGPYAKPPNVLKAYSKLWNSLVQAQNFFFQSMNTPELERRFSRMDVCLDFNLSIGQARYFDGKVAIPSPKIEKFLQEFVGDEQLWHELGHLLMAYVIGPDKVASILQSSPTRCNPHSPSMKVDSACAFLEGWGYYVTMVLKKSPVIFNLDYSKKLV